MKPDLVLDEDDKKKRFKKYNNSEEAVQSGEQNIVTLLGALCTYIFCLTST